MLYTIGCFVPSLVEVDLVYLHLEKGVVLSLNKHEFALPKAILCRVRLKLALAAGRGRPYRATPAETRLYTEDRASCIGDDKQGVLRTYSKLKHHSFAFVFGNPTFPTL